MKVKLYLCGALLCLFFNAASLFAAPPTTPASNVVFSFIDGASLRVNWTSGNGAQRLIIARAGSAVTAVPANGTDYLANAAFGSGFQISPNEYVIGKTGSFNTDVSALQPNTVYHFAVFEFNGTGASTEYLATPARGSVSTVTAPTIQASAVNFTNIIGNSLRVNWTNGNGAKRIVVMKQGGAVDVNPVDLINYNGSPQFGLGTAINGGNYVVYNGSANNATVSNLDPSTIYHVAVFEANGSTTPVYLTTSAARGSQATLVSPTIPASGTSIGFIETTTLRLNWSPGNGTKRIVVARAGIAVDAVPVNGVDYLPGINAAFNTAPEISSGQKVVYDGSSSFNCDISGLAPGTTYYFRVYEYDGTGSGIGYLTSSFATGTGATLGTPTTQAGNVIFSNATSASIQVQWANGNGSRRIVLVKAGSPVDTVPVNFNSYSAVPAFGSGSQIGSGNFVVYNSGGSSVNVTNLVTGVTYYFAVFEGNGNTEPVYLTGSPATGSQATSNRPTLPSASLLFSGIEGNAIHLAWTPGNGSRRIVVARAGSAVDAAPADGTDYLTAAVSPFNSAPEISSGQKVVFDDNASSFDLTGLNPATTYYFRIYEYDGSGSQIRYLTSSYASGNTGTVTAPITQASGISITNISSNTMQVNWVSGSGSRRMVIARAGGPVDAVPSDLTSYSANSSFGSGPAITTGNFVLYNGSGNSVTVSNLLLNSTYHFAVFEFNGVGAPVYLTANQATGNATTAAQPTVASSSLSFSFIEGNSMQLNWVSGNGTKRIVVARAGSAVDAVPANGVDYLAGSSAAFNTAPEISPGQKVIFDNSSSVVGLTGLIPNTTYYFKVYEYDGSGSSIGYLTTSVLAGSASTAKDPTLQAGSVSFTSVTANSALISWTNGNGEGRMVVMRQAAAVNADPVDLTNYNPSNTFGSGGQVGSGNFTVYKNNNSSFTVVGLTAGTTYHVALYEYNGNTVPMYLTPGLTGQLTTTGPPAIQAGSAIASSVTGTSVQLNWTNGSGNRRVVLMKQGSAVDMPPANNIHYFANSFFGSGNQLGTGNYVVFDGTQNAVTVTNLQTSSTYYFAVYEYNDFGATTQVLTANPAAANFTTGTLPVTLIGFEASAEKDHIKLAWATAQEHNSAYFSIERSSNGIDFNEIGRLQSKGESSIRSNYAYDDHSPFDGFNYYRLKQVDRDGRKTYSFIIHINFAAQQLVRKMINPVVNQLDVELFKQPAANAFIKIYGMNGHCFKKETLTGSHINTNVAALPAGIYVLEIYVGSNTERVKFVKQ